MQVIQNDANVLGGFLDEQNLQRFPPLSPRCLRTDHLTTDHRALFCWLVLLCCSCVVLCVFFVAVLFLHGVSNGLLYHKTKSRGTTAPS